MAAVAANSATDCKVGGLRPRDVADAGGVSTQTVRRLERSGVLPPALRTAAGYRQYDARHVAALRTFRAVAAGYSHPEALRVLQLLNERDVEAAYAVVHQRHALIDARLQAADAALDPAIAIAGPALTISAASRRTGVPVTTIRHWERAGLIEPARSAGNRYRLYDGRLQLRLAAIRRLTELGLGLPAIRRILATRTTASDLAEASRRCVAATAAVWAYAQRADG